MAGIIVETRTRIHERVVMSHVVKSIKFLGDFDNNLTEICISSKLARCFTEQLSKVRTEYRVLGDPYPIDCNPFIPRWDDMELVAPDIGKRRSPRHVKKILDQWYSWAKRSQSQSIRYFYTKLLVRVASDAGKHPWSQMVERVTVDTSIATYPKVVKIDQVDTDPVNQRPNKRRADERNSPSAHTLISVMRKRKGRKKANDGANDGANMSDDDDDSSSSLGSENEI